MKMMRNVVLVIGILVALSGMALAQSISPYSGELTLSGLFSTDGPDAIPGTADDVLGAPLATQNISGVGYMTGGAIFGPGPIPGFPFSPVYRPNTSNDNRGANYTFVFQAGPGTITDPFMGPADDSVVTEYTQGTLFIYRATNLPGVPTNNSFGSGTPADRATFGDDDGAATASTLFLSMKVAFLRSTFDPRPPGQGSVHGTVQFTGGELYNDYLLPNNLLDGVLDAVTNLFDPNQAPPPFGNGNPGTYDLAADGRINIFFGPTTRPLPPTLTVQKFYDTDRDGVKDVEEPFILGWQVTLFDEAAGASFSATRYTEVVESLFTGRFGVRESASLVGNWIATTPTQFDNIPLTEGLERWNGSSWVQVTPPQNRSVLFGNVCLESDVRLQPRTIGYWQNKAGTAFASTQQAGLTLLNLTDGLGNDFDPTLFDFKSTAPGSWSYWLSQANAKSMAYMLSAQMVGTWLNTRFYLANPGAGMGLNPGSILSVGGYFAGTPLASLVESQNGTITIQQLLDAANTELGAHSYTPEGSADRHYQELLKSFFDALNNGIRLPGVGFTQQAVQQPTQVNGIYTGPCPFRF